MKIKKKRFSARIEHFFPQIYAQLYTHSNYWGRCRCGPFSNYWGKYSQIIGGIYLPLGFGTHGKVWASYSQKVRFFDKNLLFEFFTYWNFSCRWRMKIWVRFKSLKDSLLYLEEFAGTGMVIVDSQDMIVVRWFPKAIQCIPTNIQSRTSEPVWAFAPESLELVCFDQMFPSSSSLKQQDLLQSKLLFHKQVTWNRYFFQDYDTVPYLDENGKIGRHCSINSYILYKSMLF